MVGGGREDQWRFLLIFAKRLSYFNSQCIKSPSESRHTVVCRAAQEAGAQHP